MASGRSRTAGTGIQHIEEFAQARRLHEDAVDEADHCLLLD